MASDPVGADGVAEAGALGHTARGVARQLGIAQGFTLSTTGTFSVLVTRHPVPGPIAVWLFVAGATSGYVAVVLGSRAYRDGETIGSLRHYQLFNLTAVVVVPLCILGFWWISGPYVAYPVAGLLTSSSYLLAFSAFAAAARCRHAGRGSAERNRCASSARPRRRSEREARRRRPSCSATQDPPPC